MTLFNAMVTFIMLLNELNDKNGNKEAWYWLLRIFFFNFKYNSSILCCFEIKARVYYVHYQSFCGK